MAPQCTASDQSCSPPPRPQKSLQRLQPTFCCVHSHTCKFGGKNHEICGGSFYTEIPSVYNILGLDTWSESSWAIILMPVYWRPLTPRHHPRPSGKKERGNRKVICAFAKLPGWFFCSWASTTPHWLVVENHKDILKHSQWLIPLCSSKGVNGIQQQREGKL